MKSFNGTWSIQDSFPHIFSMFCSTHFQVLALFTWLVTTCSCTTINRVLTKGTLNCFAKICRIPKVVMDDSSYLVIITWPVNAYTSCMTPAIWGSWGSKVAVWRLCLQLVCLGTIICITIQILAVLHKLLMAAPPCRSTMGLHILLEERWFVDLLTALNMSAISIVWINTKLCSIWSHNSAW